jgi:septum formation protein
VSYRFVLASASPRRFELLGQLGVEFTVKVPAIVEQRREGESPSDYVQRNAAEKSAKVHSELQDTAIVTIAADTIVVVDADILEKPIDRMDAKRMLQMLSGRMHEVQTGVCIQSHDRCDVWVQTTHVYFKKLGLDEIERYLDTGEPFDKAGSYAAQGRGSYFIKSIEGSYTNVVGLPLAEVQERLAAYCITAEA